jgi:outer membrane protein assembly factor BamB
LFACQLWKVEVDGPVFSSPLLWRDLVFVGCDDGHLYGVQRRYAPAEQGNESQAVGERATVVLKLRAESAITSSPSLLPLLLISPGTALDLVARKDGGDEAGERAVLAFCAADNNVSLVGLTSATPLRQGGEDQSNGTGRALSVEWQWSTTISAKGKKVFSSPIVLHDRLLCASRDNSLYCFTFRRLPLSQQRQDVSS